MKKLLFITTLLMLSLSVFADGSVICEDRTSTDQLEAYQLEAGESDCKDGYVKQGNDECVPQSNGGAVQDGAGD